MLKHSGVVTMSLVLLQDTSDAVRNIICSGDVYVSGSADLDQLPASIEDSSNFNPFFEQMQ